jgi:hypothetical protein
LGNVAKRPVLNVLSGTHFGADVTLGLGEVHATTEELAKRHQANFSRMAWRMEGRHRSPKS